MFIYHITEERTWQQAKLEGVYTPVSFEADGFIHCSTEVQVLEVANRYYKNAERLVLLRINPSELMDPVVFENLEGQPELYPHIYGKLPLNAVVQVEKFEQTDDGQYSFPPFAKPPAG